MSEIINKTGKGFVVSKTGIIIIVSGLAIIGSGLGLYIYTNRNEVENNSNQSKINPTSIPEFIPTQIPTATVNPTTTSTVAPTLVPTLPKNNLMQYTNLRIGYEISYPKEWVVFGPNWDFKFGPENNGESSCATPPIVNPTNEVDVIEIAKTLPNNCNWVPSASGKRIPRDDSEFSIVVYSTPHSDISSYSDDGIIVNLNGIEAYKYIFTENSPLPNIRATRIYFNYENKGFVLYLRQTDLSGNYDKVLDEILASLRFL